VSDSSEFEQTPPERVYIASSVDHQPQKQEEGDAFSRIRALPDRKNSLEERSRNVLGKAEPRKRGR